MQLKLCGKPHRRDEKTDTEHALAVRVSVGLVHAGAQSLLCFVFSGVGISVKTNI